MKRTAIRDHLNRAIVSALKWGTKKLGGSGGPQSRRMGHFPFQSSLIRDVPLVVVPDASPNDPYGVLLDRLLGEQKPLYLAATAARTETSRARTRQLAFSGAWHNRRELYHELSSALLRDRPSYVLCAPRTNRELQVAVAAADISGAPMVLYLIGDLESSSELDPALCEAIKKSSLLFAASEGMRAKYQKKYGRKVWLLPPVAPEAPPLAAQPRPDKALRGVLLGEPANSSMIDQVQTMVRKSQLHITWIVAPGRISSARSRLGGAEHISLECDTPDDLFAQALARADFVLAVDGIQEEKPGSSLEICLLSDLLCAVCWTGLPVVCLGNKSGNLAKLIDAWGLGSCLEIEQKDLRSEIDTLITPEKREAISKKAIDFRAVSSAQAAAKLLRCWIEQGFVVENPFDEFFEPIQDKLTPFVDAESPHDIHWEFKPHYDALTRLKRTGYRPDFIVDLGASTGYWSLVAQRVFGEAEFFLVDPLIEKYREEEGGIYKLHPEFNRIATAVGAVPGETVFHVSQDLYGSSIFNLSAFPDDRRFTPLKVPIRTLDQIAKTENIKGRGILKIDVQFSEHLVLEGASEFLRQIDFVLIEVSLKRFTPEVKVLGEFVEIFKRRGFRYYDFAGDWRDSQTGELLQHDIIFARETADGSPAG